ncbi:unnamed protein product [Clonostachys solani]|uniref:Cytochrome P450 n=1 Tax=Clonostachys solani TaxID=160281 RepID=A0A9P0EJY1_9HYPO|nr:unnamed protein product [Clonostachys solani]
MLALISVIGLVALGLFSLVLQHVYVYLRDAKGLRKFPGMTPLAPFTNIPYLRVTGQGRRFKAVYEAHQRLGPVVRVGPNSVSFSDPVAIKDVYGHGSPVTKDTFYDNVAGSHRHLADVSDKHDHSRKRRVLAAAYSQAGLESWEHIVFSRTRALVDQYDKQCISPEYHPSPHAIQSTSDPNKTKGYINHRQWMNIFAEDAICQIGMSADLHMLEKGTDTVTIETHNGKKITIGYRASLWGGHKIQRNFAWSHDWYKRMAKLTSWHPGWAHNKNYDAMVYYFTRKRLERYNKGEKLDDFFTYLFEDKYGNPNMYPMGELAAEASIMMNAGSDTTAIALTNVLYWLLKNPDALAKLREELDAVLDPDEPVAPFDRVKHLPYLRACLDESMRLTPPNTMNIPRITPPQGLSVMGHWIPGRTTVHCSTYTIHRNPKIFIEPLAYKPERWLGDEGKDLQQHFLTFSAGARGCIGRNITYMEQTIVLASLIFRFNFSLMSDDWVLEQEESFTCSPSDFPIRVRRRDFENLKA